MSNFYLFLVIGLLLVYITGLRNGVSSNRVVIGGSSSEERESSSLTWIFVIVAVVAALHFLSPPEFRIGSLLPNIASPAAPSPEVENGLPLNPEEEATIPPIEDKTKNKRKERPEDLSDFAFQEVGKVNTVYILQAGVFEYEENAIRLKSELGRKLPLTIITTAAGMHYVGYGPFRTEREAKEFGERHNLDKSATSFQYR